jgi:hypothetical protein
MNNLAIMKLVVMYTSYLLFFKFIFGAANNSVKTMMINLAYVQEIGLILLC